MTEKEEPTISDVNALKEQAKLKPNDLKSQRAVGWAHYGKDQVEEARAVFENITARWPDDLEGHYGLGMSLKKLGQAGSAKESFKKAAEAQDKTVRESMLKRLAEQQQHIILG